MCYGFPSLKMNSFLSWIFSVLVFLIFWRTESRVSYEQLLIKNACSVRRNVLSFIHRFPPLGSVYSLLFPTIRTGPSQPFLFCLIYSIPESIYTTFELELMLNFELRFIDQ